ncbi:MAG: hypothetical protein ACKOAD_05030 [Gammaproteobacteria bacterium]
MNILTLPLFDSRYKVYQKMFVPTVLKLPNQKFHSKISAYYFIKKKYPELTFKMEQKNYWASIETQALSHQNPIGLCLGNRVLKQGGLFFKILNQKDFDILLFRKQLREILSQSPYLYYEIESPLFILSF